MKILVLGGAGFIGSHVVDSLIRKGRKVVVVDNLSTGSRKNLNPKAKFYKLDIQNSQLEKVFKKEKPEVVLHFAAQIDVRKSMEHPLEDAKTNILGSLNVLENSRKYKVKKIIFASTGGAIYGEAKKIPTPETHPAHPLSPYGAAKLAVEQYLGALDIPFVALRFSNVYGPRQNSKGEAGVVAIFADKILHKKNPVIFGSGLQTRDFLYVQDAVAASLLAFEKQKTGIFNVGTGKETSVNELFRQLKALTKFQGKAQRKSSSKGEVQRSCLDAKRMRLTFGWKPRYSLQQGLKKTVESLK